MTSPAAPARPGTGPLPALAAFVIAAPVPGELLDTLTPGQGERSWARVDTPHADWAAWLLAWGPGSSAGWHDHGTSSGAFAVISGTLTEHSLARGAHTEPDSGLRLPGGGPRSRTVAAGQVRPFGPQHVHDVLNETTEVAYSLHVYAPDLPFMRRYERRDDRLILTRTEVSGRDW
ncbi:cysteine dioxygenase [Streptomyces mirabilis]|uniref:cysteine dioxygenase n=1 Tax=Streptomyces mirabilis TaxID=68239 RepID=UPI00365D6FAF